MSEVGKAVPLADKNNFYKNSSKETKSSQSKNYSTISQSVSTKIQDRQHYANQMQKEFLKNSTENSAVSSFLHYQGQGQGGGSDLKHAFEI